MASVSAMEVEEKSHQTQDNDASMDTSDALPNFKPLTAQQIMAPEQQYQRIRIPNHRLSPLQEHWMEIYQPIVEHMKLQIRYNTKKKCVELRTCKQTESPSAMQKSADFVRAFALGFDLRDAVALLRLDDLYIDSFEIKDVKALAGDHLARAIGRIAGIGGKTKHTIENSTKTRIVLADSHIHILGSYRNIKSAKDGIVRLIMGAPPGKVYTQMRSVASRQKERF